MGVTVGEEVFPEVAVQTEAQILEVLKNTVGPIHHAAATCTHSVDAVFPLVQNYMGVDAQWVEMEMVKLPSIHKGWSF
ncbi:hypothetical protein B0A49_02531 [Cryomyces minteri]|uniref:Uncharacterized protein n=1 Tax=Cryomyces minteri TaxID=331657 RepID=A0A4U0XVW1_9PEZI|nr:hypothetical protein B0A49_02531 [Cryomyces minteri]